MGYLCEISGTVLMQLPNMRGQGGRPSPQTPLPKGRGAPRKLKQRQFLFCLLQISWLQFSRFPEKVLQLVGRPSPQTPLPRGEGLQGNSNNVSFCFVCCKSRGCNSPASLSRCCIWLGGPHPKPLSQGRGAPRKLKQRQFLFCLLQISWLQFSRFPEQVLHLVGRPSPQTPLPRGEGLQGNSNNVSFCFVCCKSRGQFSRFPEQVLHLVGRPSPQTLLMPASRGRGMRACKPQPTQSRR